MQQYKNTFRIVNPGKNAIFAIVEYHIFTIINTSIKVIKNNHQIRNYALKIATSADPIQKLSDYRKALSSQFYNSLLDELRSSSIYNNLICPSKTISYLDLDRKTLFPVSNEDELKWAKCILIKNADSLSTFIALSNNFQMALMSGDYVNSKALLEKIEESFGQSIWLIKNKIAFLQIYDGLEAQKKYVQHVKDNSKFNGSVSFISHWISIRNEGTVTAARFMADFNNLMKTLEPYLSELAPYVRYEILADESFNVDDAIKLLRKTFSKSIIDFYEAFVTVSRIILFSEEQEIQNQLVYNLKKITEKIQDDRINVLLNSLTKTPFLFADLIKTTDAEDLFLSSQYDEASSIINDSLKIEPNNPSLLLIASKIMAVIPKENSTYVLQPNGDNEKLTRPLSEHVINLIAKVIEKGTGGANVEANELTKLSLNFASHHWSLAINGALCEEQFSDLFSKKRTQIAVMKFPGISAQFLPFFESKKNQSYYLGNILKNYGLTLSVSYACKLIGNSADGSIVSLSDDAKNLLHGHMFLINGEFEKALLCGESLINSNNSYYSRQGHKLKGLSLLQLNNILSLCEYVAEVYVNDAQLYPMLPLKELVAKLHPNAENWVQCNHFLCLSIVIDAITKQVAKKIESERTYALEDFLDSINLTRPSQIHALVDQYDRKQLIYFLRYICINSVMDMSILFSGANEVVLERISICKLLITLDPSNEDEYEQEIKDLVRIEVLNSRLLEIDQSRIYVDIPKVKEWAARELRESFNRYIQYLKHGLDSESLANREEALARANENDVEGLLAMSVPQNEVNALFKHLVTELMNAYTSNPEFGLDRYLSTRIRHGVLESHLRRPLDAYHLLTQREGEKGDYKSNVYWIEQLGLDNEDAGKLDKILGNFSASYDNIIKTIISEWLQVRKIEGLLFAFPISDGEVSYLASQISPNTTLNKFLDIVIGYLDERLSGDLEVIRFNLQERSKRDAVELLNKLQVEISNLNFYYITGNLDTSINFARTDIQGVFDRIVEWFSPFKSVMSTPFTVDDAINVAEVIVKQAAPNFAAPFFYTTKDTSVTIRGGLPTFVDILVNIFENVVKRSGLEVPIAETSITLQQLTEKTQMLVIKVVNNLSSIVDLDELREKLSKRKKQLEGQYGNSISKEGGSGFFKIHRSLKDFKSPITEIEPFMEFGVENNQYFITIAFPVRFLGEEILD